MPAAIRPPSTRARKPPPLPPRRRPGGGVKAGCVGGGRRAGVGPAARSAAPIRYRSRRRPPSRPRCRDRRGAGPGCGGLFGDLLVGGDAGRSSTRPRPRSPLPPRHGLPRRCRGPRSPARPGQFVLPDDLGGVQVGIVLGRVRCAIGIDAGLFPVGFRPGAQFRHDLRVLDAIIRERPWFRVRFWSPPPRGPRRRSHPRPPACRRGHCPASCRNSRRISLSSGEA